MGADACVNFTIHYHLNTSQALLIVKGMALSIVAVKLHAISNI